SRCDAKFTVEKWLGTVLTGWGPSSKLAASPPMVSVGKT
ncbi:unnamed protein product, partial [marine sediment metagenome]